MADIHVYYFSTRDRTTGKARSSKRRATLDAIKGLGEPVLESRLVVDSSEVDMLGFLVSRQETRSEVDEIWGEIRSLRLRASSRERKAKQLLECDAELQRVLRTEGQELLMRANRLRQLIHPEVTASDRA